MNEVEQLRSDLAELRESTRVLLALIATAIATTPNSAEATKALAGRLAVAENHRAKSDTFWEAASGVLKMMSSSALQQFPQDPELLAIHHGVRPGRH